MHLQAGSSNTDAGEQYSPSQHGLMMPTNSHIPQLLLVLISTLHNINLLHMQVLFHGPFLARCKELIAAAIAEACSSLHGPLQSALDAAAQHEPEAAGQLQPGSWPCVLSSGRGAGTEAGALERAGSLWTSGSLRNANSVSGLGLSGRLLSGHASGLLREDQGAAGEGTKLEDSWGGFSWR